MIEVRVDKIGVHRGHLVMGLVVYGPSGSWVRFTEMSVMLTDIPRSVLDEAQVQRYAAREEEHQEQRLF